MSGGTMSPISSAQARKLIDALLHTISDDANFECKPAPRRAAPCPFCGHKKLELHLDKDKNGTRYAWIWCECGGSGPSMDEDQSWPKSCKTEAINIWNRRAN